jgi:hypothetical protein
MATTPDDDPAAFDQFIAHWRKARLAGMPRADLTDRLDTLASELTLEALAQGHRVALTNASRPYRHIRDYVAALHDIADTRHFKD